MVKLANDKAVKPTGAKNVLKVKTDRAEIDTNGKNGKAGGKIGKL